MEDAEKSQYKGYETTIYPALKLYMKVRYQIDVGKDEFRASADPIPRDLFTISPSDLVQAVSKA